MDEPTSQETNNQEIHELLRWLRADGLIERVAVRSAAAASLRRRLDHLHASVTLGRTAPD